MMPADAEIPRFTVEEKICLHLLDFVNLRDEFILPEEISQKGIADVIQVKRGHASVALISLKKKDLVEERVSTTTPINMGVVHARAPEVGQEIYSRVTERFNCQDSYLYELCASLTVHFGPGVIGLCFYAV